MPRSRKTAVLKKMFARQMQWLTEDGEWVDEIEACMHIFVTISSSSRAKNVHANRTSPRHLIIPQSSINRDRVQLQCILLYLKLCKIIISRMALGFGALMV